MAMGQCGDGIFEKPEELMPKLPVVMLAVAALLGLGPPAEAQQRGWPARPVKLVVSTPPGSGQDLIAQTLTEPLQKRLGQPFIVENIPGAGSVRSADVVVKRRLMGTWCSLPTSPRSASSQTCGPICPMTRQRISCRSGRSTPRPSW